MTEINAAATRSLATNDRIIVALDVESATDAKRILSELRDRVGAFKIGLQLFTAAGPKFVQEITASGVKVFLDLKFHDIPNTVAKAAVEAAKLGVWMFNVHTAGGSEMMRRTSNEVGEYGDRTGAVRPLIIGVTVLTSSNAETLNEIGLVGDLEKQVVKLAQLARASGLDGVVASPREVTAIQKAIKDTSFITVTPGIRPITATADDQRRVTTLRDAIANGADYVVIGRPITQAENRIHALEAMLAEPEN